MKKVLGLSLVLALLVAGVSVLAEGEASLADWNGRWNGFQNYFENEGIVEAYEKKAETDGTTAEEAKAYYVSGETYRSEIVAIAIEGDTIAFYDTMLAPGSDAEPIATSAYAFVEMAADANDREWAYFQAQDDAAPYKVMLLLPAEADVPG
ncbi:metal-binding protein ZinT, partial [Eubacteriales bacterium OttesenSCG-928-A19]|nr:metal-binding protein ZinT [Eubacteriales bacterium OttesenSCG-928-A19]